MQVFENHTSWPSVKEACHILHKKGFDAYLAGGCVRDGLIHRLPSDFDIATNALPDEVEKLFEKTVSVGKSFGVIKVLIDGHQLDIATLRKDGDYKDGRHPETIEFGDLKEDSNRRDFTINAMFYNMKNQQVIDFHGGKQDLSRQLLKTVGEPSKRFSEDYLRVLRAIRFSTQLGFTIENKTWSACYQFADKMHSLSRERIRNEVIKIIKSNHAIEGLYRLQCLNILFSDFNNKDMQNSKLFILHQKNTSWVDFLSTLMIGKFDNSMIEDLKQRFVLTAEEVKALKANAQALHNISNKDIRVAQKLIDFENQNSHNFLRKYAQCLAPDSKDLNTLLKKYDDIKNENGLLPEAIITPEDLISHGVQPGPEMGLKLKKAYYKQLEEGIIDKQILTSLVLK